jgi:hypothetical protein
MKPNPQAVPAKYLKTPSVVLDPLSLLKLSYLRSYYLDRLNTSASVSSIVRRALDALLTQVSACAAVGANGPGKLLEGREVAERERMVFAHRTSPAPAGAPESVSAIGPDGTPRTWTEALRAVSVPTV